MKLIIVVELSLKWSKNALIKHALKRLLFTPADASKAKRFPPIASLTLFISFFFLGWNRSKLIYLRIAEIWSSKLSSLLHNFHPNPSAIPSLYKCLWCGCCLNEWGRRKSFPRHQSQGGEIYFPFFLSLVRDSWNAGSTEIHFHVIDIIMMIFSTQAPSFTIQHLASLNSMKNGFIFLLLWILRHR